MPRHSPDLLRRFPGLPRHETLEQEPPAQDRGEDEGARCERQLAMLRRIADMAMDLSERAYRRAVAEDEAVGAAAGAPPAVAGRAGAGDAVEADADVDADADGRALERLEGQIEGLERALSRGGAAGEAGAEAARGDPSLVFARLSRVMFRAFALENRIAAEAAAAKAEAEAEANRYYDPAITPEREAKIKERWNLLLSRKNLVVTVVQAAIAEQRPNEDAAACARALNDYLLEFERSQVLNQTTRVNSQRQCDRLGLVLDWSRWEQEDWALAEADGQLAWNRHPYPVGGGGP